ncbi:hypothetical protein BKA70DRAFT_1225951 [Coprinopsis sp. MPI-PUGE-AT-0042]|nr:hypothetical protein BKA70DRAFT_1225951 [Coprinopsis sp. MPI-PUGE-AT-0042]
MAPMTPENSKQAKKEKKLKKKLARDEFPLKSDMLLNEIKGSIGRDPDSSMRRIMLLAQELRDLVETMGEMFEYLTGYAPHHKLLWEKVKEIRGMAKWVMHPIPPDAMVDLGFLKALQEQTSVTPSHNATDGARKREWGGGGEPEGGRIAVAQTNISAAKAKAKTTREDQGGDADRESGGASKENRNEKQKGKGKGKKKVTMKIWGQDRYDDVSPPAAELVDGVFNIPAFENEGLFPLVLSPSPTPESWMESSEGGRQPSREIDGSDLETLEETPKDGSSDEDGDWMSEGPSNEDGESQDCKMVRSDKDNGKTASLALSRKHATLSQVHNEESTDSDGGEEQGSGNEMVAPESTNLKRKREGPSPEKEKKRVKFDTLPPWPMASTPCNHCVTRHEPCQSRQTGTCTNCQTRKVKCQNTSVEEEVRWGMIVYAARMAMKRGRRQRTQPPTHRVIDKAAVKGNRRDGNGPNAMEKEQANMASVRNDSPTPITTRSQTRRTGQSTAGDHQVGRVEEMLAVGRESLLNRKMKAVPRAKTQRLPAKSAGDPAFPSDATISMYTPSGVSIGEWVKDQSVHRSVDVTRTSGAANTQPPAASSVEGEIDILRKTAAFLQREVARMNAKLETLSILGGFDSRENLDRVVGEIDGKMSTQASQEERRMENQLAQKDTALLNTMGKMVERATQPLATDLRSVMVLAKETSGLLENHRKTTVDRALVETEAMLKKRVGTAVSDAVSAERITVDERFSKLETLCEEAINLSHGRASIDKVREALEDHKQWFIDEHQVDTKNMRQIAIDITQDAWNTKKPTIRSMAKDSVQKVIDEKLKPIEITIQDLRAELKATVGSSVAGVPQGTIDSIVDKSLHASFARLLAISHIAEPLHNNPSVPNPLSARFLQIESPGILRVSPTNLPSTEPGTTQGQLAEGHSDGVLKDKL